MIPVLGVPYLNRPDLFHAMLASIDVPVDKMVIIDNSPGRDLVPLATIAPGHNLGVSASWNLIVKATPLAPWWCISNADVQFGAGDLARLAAAMVDHPVAMLHDPSVFAFRKDALERVGWFDENFVPGYCEDNDWMYRCRLAGVHVEPLPSGTTHFGSAVIRSDPAYLNENNRTYPRNVDYYQRKWGGSMGEEVFETPFNRGGDPNSWALSIDRLADLTWRV